VSRGEPVDLSGLDHGAAIAKIAEVCNGPNPVTDGPLGNVALWEAIYQRLIEPLLKVDGDARERHNHALCWDQGYRAAKEEATTISEWLAVQRAGHTTPFPRLPANPYRREL
jgi:hypothetical protein